MTQVTTAAPAAPSPSVPPATGHHRIDALDGIRAVAVLAVIAFHVGVPGVSGGFLGVDAFFVLSGYLITGLLLADVRRHGRVRLGRFWSRRVLRLMPAFLVVVLAVIVWGATVAPAFQRPALSDDATASLLYVANWHFIGEAGYFSDDGTTSPLQHVWSLAVEEQFYLLWPLVVVAATGVIVATTRRRADVCETSAAQVRGGRVARQLAVIGILGSVVSVVLLSVLFDPAAPDRAYMGTDSRAFQPLLGAVLACLATHPAVRAFWTRHAQAVTVIGAAGLGIGIATIGSGGGGVDAAYADGGAVAVTVACVLLVAGAAHGDARRGPVRALAWGPVAALGRISYGVYLWHWPLVVWLLPDEGFDPVRAAIVAVGSVVAAAASYRLVELPIREGRMRRLLTPRRLVPAVALSLALGLGTAHALPQVGPFPGGLLGNGSPAPTAGPRSVMIVGDSVPLQLIETLAREGEERGQVVTTAARGSCPGLGVTVTSDGGKPPEDPDLHCGRVVPSGQVSMLDQSAPDVVVWWSRYEMSDRLGDDGEHLVAGTPRFWAAQQVDLERTIDRLSAGGATVVAVEIDRPGTGMYTRCSEDDCHPFLRRLLDDDDLRQAWNARLRAQAAVDPRLKVITIDDVFCHDDAVPCDDALPDGTLARPDGSHFSDEAQPAVAEALLDRVTAAVS